MPKTNAETMTVRLPTQIANELMKLRDDKNLPTIGSALQIYIQKMKDDQIQRQFDRLFDYVVWLESNLIASTTGLEIRVDKKMLSEVRVIDLRRAKKNLERIGKTNTGTYKAICSFLAMGEEDQALYKKRLEVEQLSKKVSGLLKNGDEVNQTTYQRLEKAKKELEELHDTGSLWHSWVIQALAKIEEDRPIEHVK